MTSLIPSPISRFHLQLGAKMTEFAGYQMPLHYKDGIIKEHLHCRSEVGFFDISHMGQLWITGNNVDLALEKLIPSAISKLNINQQCYSVLTNVSGGVVDDIVITRFEDGFFMVVNAVCKEKDLIHFKTLLNPDCNISILDEQALFALQGTTASDILGKYCKAVLHMPFMHSILTTINSIECIISRCGYSGEDGFEISVSSQDALEIASLLLANDSVKPIGLGARDSLRLEAGLCLYGHELNEEINPVAAGLSWTFRKNFENVIGGEKLLEAKQQGTKQKRVGLLVEDKRPVRAGCSIFNQQDVEIGKVTSGGYSPILKRPIAMAYLDSSEIDEKISLYAKVRDKKIPVSLTKLPFVPHRYHKS